MNPNPRIPTLKFTNLPPSPQPLLLTPQPYRLQITSLVENNLLQWTRSVHMVIRGKGKSEFPDGTVPKPGGSQLSKLGHSKLHGDGMAYSLHGKVLEILIFFIPRHRKFGMSWPWHTLISKIHLKYTNFVIG